MVSTATSPQGVAARTEVRGYPKRREDACRVWSSEAKTHHKTHEIGGSSLRSTTPYGFPVSLSFFGGFARNFILRLAGRRLVRFTTVSTHYRKAIMKSIDGIGLSEVQAVYNGAEGQLWELIMGEQIHLGGFASSMDLAEKAGIKAGTSGVNLCCCSGDRHAPARPLPRRGLHARRHATETVVKLGQQRSQAPAWPTASPSFSPTSAGRVFPTPSPISFGARTPGVTSLIRSG